MRYFRYFIGLTALLAGLAIDAKEASKKGGSINYNGGRRIPHYSWASVDYVVDNPKNRAVKVKIRTEPIDQRNKTIYETIFDVGPDTTYSFSDLITIGSVDEYGVDMFLGTERLTDASQRLNYIRLAHPLDRYIVFINDEQDLTYGHFAKNTNLGSTYLNCMNQTRKMPRHWAGYDNAAIVVVMRLDFANVVNRQYKALLDYVARGGTVLFSDPQGLMAAWDTPLRQCIPVTPLRLRKIEHLTALSEIGGTEKRWDDGTDFLESLPNGPGLTTLKHEDFPLVRWRRHGLGLVGVCAVSPSDEGFVSEGKEGVNFNTYWRHLLSYSERCDYASSSQDIQLTGAVDKLTGVKIPSASFIRNVVFCYLVAVLILVALGVVFKQQLKAWAALAIIAIVTIIGIFMYAGYMRRHLPRKTATILEFASYGTEQETVEQLVCLFLKDEQTMDLKADGYDYKIRSMPPARDPKEMAQSWFSESISAKLQNSKKRGKKGTRSGKEDKGENEAILDPLRVSTVNGRSGLLNLNLRDSKPQFFNTLANLPGPTHFQPPVVTWDTGRPVIEAWKIPDGLNCEYAALILEEGYYPVSIKDGSLVRKASDPLADKASPIYASLRDFLVRAKSPVPLIAAFSELDKDRNGLIDKETGFSVMGRRINLVPVIDPLNSGPRTIPGARISIDGHPENKQIMRINETWVFEDQRATREPLRFQAQLPIGYSRFKPEEIVVDFQANNSGGNMTFAILFLPDGDVKRKVRLKKREDGRWVLDCSKFKPHEVIDPANGYIELALVAKEKTKIRDGAARLRFNTWKIQKIQVSASGILPEETQGRL